MSAQVNHESERQPTLEFQTAPLWSIKSLRLWLDRIHQISSELSAGDAGLRGNVLGPAILPATRSRPTRTDARPYGLGRVFSLNRLRGRGAEPQTGSPRKCFGAAGQPDKAAFFAGRSSAQISGSPLCSSNRMSAHPRWADDPVCIRQAGDVRGDDIASMAFRLFSERDQPRSATRPILGKGGSAYQM